jgi:LCP family protein required for cell wall assembly
MSNSVRGRSTTVGTATVGAAPPPRRPPIPPAARKRPKDPVWARLLVIFGALLMVGSGGLIITAKVATNALISGIPKGHLLPPEAAQNGHSINGPLNVLLVGVDQRPEFKPTDLIRSDSIIIVHVNASHDQATLVSIPRDLYVEIPADKKTGYRGGHEKINAAFAFGNQNNGGREGGVQLLAATIKLLTGIQFNAAAIIDFGGFDAVVKALGGVDMCIDEEVTSHHMGYDKNGKFLVPYGGPDGTVRDPRSTPVKYEPGCYHLPAYKALDYVRQRYGLPNGDYDRQRHQQQFLKAILKEARKQGVTSNPVKLYEIIHAAGAALTVDTNGVSLDDWLYTVRNLVDNEPIMLKTNAGKLSGGIVNGQDVEMLTDDSKTMFQAVKSDQLEAFVATHPDFVATDTLNP